jgi:DNA modification methylase
MQDIGRRFVQKEEEEKFISTEQEKLGENEKRPSRKIDVDHYR